MKGWAWAPADSAAHFCVGMVWRRLSPRARRRGEEELWFSMTMVRKSMTFPVPVVCSRAMSHTACQEQSRWCSEYEMNRHREQLAQWARHVSLARCQDDLTSIRHDPLLPLSQSPTSSTVGPQKPVRGRGDHGDATSCAPQSGGQGGSGFPGTFYSLAGAVCGALGSWGLASWSLCLSDCLGSGGYAATSRGSKLSKRGLRRTERVSTHRGLVRRVWHIGAGCGRQRRGRRATASDARQPQTEGCEPAGGGGGLGIEPNISHPRLAGVLRSGSLVEGCHESDD